MRGWGPRNPLALRPALRVLLACWGWEQPVQAVSGDVRDASSPSTKEALAGKAVGREGGDRQRSGQQPWGVCVGAPHRYPGLKAGTGGKYRSHIQERFRGVQGWLTRIWVRTWAWIGFGAFRCGVESCQPHGVRYELPWELK